jgi:SPP1 gp7 family putative phage head morphogenesis protein
VSNDKLFDPPENANEALFDALVRHQIFLLRYSTSVRDKIHKLLNKSEQAIVEKIHSRLLGSNQLNSTADFKRLQTLLRIIRNIRTKSWEEVTAAWIEEAVSIAKSEPETLSKIILTTSPVLVETVIPAARLLAGIVKSRAFEGRTLRQWANSIAREDIRRIEAMIQAGMVAGDTTADIVKRIVGTVGLRGVDGVTEITRRQATSITRTAINFIANETRAEFIKENSDLVKKEKYVATLDSRTTAVCRANDGKLFDVGTGPRPPLHFNCRSLRVPVILPDGFGNRPAKPTTEKMLLREFTAGKSFTATKRNELPRGTKKAFDQYSRARIRELTGQVPADTSYQVWLGRQSREFQDDVLGKTKGRLFRDGKLQLDQFVNRVGDELTLSELVKKHADAFKAAGLDPKQFR